MSRWEDGEVSAERTNERFGFMGVNLLSWEIIIQFCVQSSHGFITVDLLVFP